MLSIQVKICGITCVEDALVAVEAGANALGFVFAPSPRQVTPEAAVAILRELPPFVTIVGLVVNQDPAPILAACPLDVIQFHGAESPETVASLGRRAIKAFRLRDQADLPALANYRAASALLLDAYVPGIAGGTGHQFPWQLAVDARQYSRPIVVAGGLTPENVALCVTTTQPYGVDVSTGVEASPGRKDPTKVRDFIAAAREALGHP